MVSTDPLIPPGAVSLANASAFGGNGAPGSKKPAVDSASFGNQVVYSNRRLIKQLAATLRINASTIGKILLEENNFHSVVGKFAESVEEQLQCVKSKSDCSDPRSGFANMHRADVDFLFDQKELGAALYERSFVFDIIGDLPSMFYRNGRIYTMSEEQTRQAIFNKSKHDDKISITLLRSISAQQIER